MPPTTRWRLAAASAARFIVPPDRSWPWPARGSVTVRLPARFVIHAVGPVWRGGGAGEPDLLASAYRSVLAIARERELTSVAFPAISTGIYGYPLVEATHIAVNTVQQELARATSVEQVTFACFGQDVLTAYRQVLRAR
jgi:O-acetyl-ADP-ribose deacetylase